jgi:hypothetical protein
MEKEQTSSFWFTKELRIFSVLFGEIFQRQQMSYLSKHKREFSGWIYLCGLLEHKNTPEYKSCYLEKKLVKKLKKRNHRMKSAKD